MIESADTCAHLHYHVLSKSFAGGLRDLFRALRAHGDEVFFHPHPLTAEAVQALVDHKGQDLYCVQVVEGRVVGYGMLRGWDEGFSVPSLGLAIHPDYRGKGYGQKMMLYLQDVAREKGAAQVRLTVMSDNKAALEMYIKANYRFKELRTGVLEGLLLLREA